jgi:hypothetical protein
MLNRKYEFGEHYFFSILKFSELKVVINLLLSCFIVNYLIFTNKLRQ